MQTNNELKCVMDLFVKMKVYDDALDVPGGNCNENLCWAVDNVEFCRNARKHHTMMS
jgi:hypothetical protein